MSNTNHNVIPGRRVAASPESIITDRGYGFRLSLRSAGMTVSFEKGN
jgi:hypothetical protein